MFRTSEMHVINVSEADLRGSVLLWWDGLGGTTADQRDARVQVHIRS